MWYLTSVPCWNQSARIAVIKLIRASAFQAEFSTLQKGKQLIRRSSLFTLHPFIDPDRLLRMDGRVLNRCLIILPSRGYFTHLYIKHLHEKYYHATIGFIQAYVNSQYWVVGDINEVIKRVIRKFVTCVIQHGKPSNQLMGHLPSDRTSVARPFSIVGVDYVEPFSTKCVGHRSTIFFKSYLLIIVCFRTQAVHLEQAFNLTCETLLTLIEGLPIVVGSH